MAKYILFIIGFIIICNLSPARLILKFMIDEGLYQYSNKEGSFTFREYDFTGRDFDMMMRRHKGFLLENKSNTDTIVFRTFKKNPLCFWRYLEFISDERYTLPYLNWQTVLKKRGEIENANNFQDF